MFHVSSFSRYDLLEEYLGLCNKVDTMVMNIVLLFSFLGTGETLIGGFVLLLNLFVSLLG